VIGLPALKNRRRALAGGLLLTAVAATAAIAAPAASAAPSLPAAPLSSAALSSAAPLSAGRAIAVDGLEGSSPPGQILFSAVGATPKGPNGRYEFVYNNIKPGSTIKDWVELFNRSTQSGAFSVYAVDATGTTLSGSLTYDEINQKPKDIGTWETFYASTTKPNATQSSFVMGGGSGVIEPFTITVPDTATPGDHTGGLIVQVAIPSVNSKGERVTIYSRIALPIELRVTGPLKAGLQVQSISTSFNNSINPFGTESASISYTVANVGNTRLRGNQVLQVSGLFGGATIHPPHLPTILPGDSVRVTQTVGGLFPLGSFTAKVTVTPTWPPTSPAVSVALNTVTSSASFFGLPWALIVLILLLAGLGYGTYRFLRWRARQHAADMAAVAAAARKDAERRMSGTAASAAASTAKTSGTTATATIGTTTTTTTGTTATATTGTTTTATATTGTTATGGDDAADSQGEAE
jgi:hypothetical protein